MTPADKPEFLKQLVGLAAIKPGKTLTPEAYEIWWTAMAAWSLEDFKAAAAQLAGSVEFMPSPFHFEQLRKAGRPTAGEAWAKVLEYARKGWTRWHGGGASLNGSLPQPQSELIDRVVQAIGGYEAIAMSNTDSTHFLERRFCEHYEAMQDAGEIREALPQLTGSTADKRLGAPIRVRALLPLSPDELS